MQKTMERIEAKRFEKPDEVRPFDKGKVEVVKFGELVVGRATFEPGWRWSTCVKPIAGTKSCEAAHFGYVLEGQIATKMDDGAEVIFKAGDVVNIPAGHDGWVVGDKPAVVLDFQGMVDYAKKKR
jgi:ethanolamine utilization protein EutQ (cupin superfamily)